MRKSLSVRKQKSPFKSEEERAGAIKKLVEIKKKHAPAALELANAALAAIQKLKELEEKIEEETSANLEHSLALPEYVPTFDDEAPDGESESGFVSFENCIEAMQKVVEKAESSIAESKEGGEGGSIAEGKEEGEVTE